MSILSNTRLTVLQTLNEVQNRLGLNKTATLDETTHSEMLLHLLNDTVQEISDFSDWQEMYEEVLVTASSSVGTYKVQSPTSARTVKNIYEIAYGDEIAPLEVRTIEDLRRLQRLSSFGTPRQFSVVGVSGINPLVRVYPIPTSANIAAQINNGGVFNCAVYVKPVVYTTADSSADVPFNARMVVSGLYAKALLEENGGEPSPQYQVAYGEYQRMRQENVNRFNSDTGSDCFFTPTGSRYG